MSFSGIKDGNSFSVDDGCRIVEYGLALVYYFLDVSEENVAF
jgi:hypothetical protein